MGWLFGRVMRPLIWLVWAFGSMLRAVLMVLLGVLGMARSLVHWAVEVRTLRENANKITQDLAKAADQQQAQNPLDQSRNTIFVLITCGQAVRNFLLSDVYELLLARFNLVILSPYAYDSNFQQRFARPGVHVLPWFESFRSGLERFFLYYLMSRTGSSTHESWLGNLEQRARARSERRIRYMQHVMVRRMSGAAGSVVGTKGMLALYHGYFLSFLPKSLFTRLFKTYRPSVVFSTTAHHVEAWPLTSMAGGYGAEAVANILSWDNTSTKPALDPHCDCYTVWSSEMRGEIARFYPYIKSDMRITGSPLFDMYYQRRGVIDRDRFLQQLGLPTDQPYILYTTNTPAGMPDESRIVAAYWQALQKTSFAGKVSLLVRLHPKENLATYSELIGLNGVAVTVAGQPHWHSSDRWLPNDQDMELLLNSMVHAAVSVNVASTMSLESFALGLPTINVAFRSSPDQKEHSLMWSFSMYHTSEHYRAIVENGAVDLARSLDELVDFTIKALQHGPSRTSEMHKTLEQKAGYCDGMASQRIVEAIEARVARAKATKDRARSASSTPAAEALPHPSPAE